jgi:YHS domain-containing protein
MKTKNLITVLASILTLAVLPAFAAEPHKGHAPGKGQAADKHGNHAAAGVPKGYPLEKCVVSGEKLGEHGKVVKVTHEGTDVYLCCNDCKKDFNKDPKKYVKMVKDAAPKK